MSFKAKYKTKIKEVVPEYLKESISMMVRDLEIKLMRTNEFKIWNGVRVPVRGICFKDQEAKYPVDLNVNEKNELEMQCDTSDKPVYGKYMKLVKEQFYPAIVISHKTGTPVQYDKEKEMLTLMVTR